MKAIRALILLCFFIPAAALAGIVLEDIYFIGNSLTHNTDPTYGYRERFGFTETSDPNADHQISGSKTLNWHLDNPGGEPTDLTAVPWGTALSNTAYDVLILQPHPGSDGTFANDMAAIEHWINLPLQKNAHIIIHSGWPGRESFLDDFQHGGDLTITTPSIEYTQGLVDALATKYQDRTFERLKTQEFIYQLHSDVVTGTSPFQSVVGTPLGDLYRDPIHMNATEGYYAMNNLMRATLGLPINEAYTSPWFQGDGNELTEEEKTYLNGVISQITSIPEPSPAFLFAVVTLAMLWHRRSTWIKEIDLKLGKSNAFTDDPFPNKAGGNQRQ